MATAKHSSLILHCTILITLTSFVSPLLLPESLPEEIQTLDIFSKIITDPFDTSAVFHPSSSNEIATLIRISYNSTRPFTISPRGVKHGTAFALDGLVIDMPSLGHGDGDHRIIVTDDGPVPYVDVGGEQLWIDVLQATLKYGLTPRVFTDYLYLTVGGTLSNAGIGGSAFRHGPQIANVYELDVIIGTGEMVTCSRYRESDLFYGALGGLGQFGVITRARIALEPAKKMARWVRLFYTDVKLFSSDQEKLISIENRSRSFDFIEGQVILSKEQVPGIKSSFFSDSDIEKITWLVVKNKGPIYLLEASAYYDDRTSTSVAENVRLLLEESHYESGFAFSQDVPVIDFHNRVPNNEAVLRSLGLWAVCHAWHNLFFPKSKILDFDSIVFKGILKNNNAVGVITLYPMNRRMWDDKMSAVIPTDEQVFYKVRFLWPTFANDREILEKEKNQIRSICESNNLGCKEYLPNYTNQADWKRHFGKKWSKFLSRKEKYDPKTLFSAEQQTFAPLQLYSKM